MRQSAPLPARPSTTDQTRLKGPNSSYANFYIHLASCSPFFSVKLEAIHLLTDIVAGGSCALGPERFTSLLVASRMKTSSLFSILGCAFFPPFLACISLTFFGKEQEENVRESVRSAEYASHAPRVTLNRPCCALMSEMAFKNSSLNKRQKKMRELALRQTQFLKSTKPASEETS